jgi:hypothetical protein
VQGELQAKKQNVYKSFTGKKPDKYLQTAQKTGIILD